MLQQFDLVADHVSSRIPDKQPTREGNSRADTWLGANPFTLVRPDNRRRIEDEAWALCRSAATTMPCGDYLSGWPQGRYTALARTRLNDLRAAIAAAAAQSAPQPAPQPAPTTCAHCPPIVTIGSGRFTMGSPAGEAGRDDNEGPQRPVRVERFELGKTEVTVAQWRAFIQATSYQTEAERNVGKEGCVAWGDADKKFDWCHRPP